MSVMAMAAEAGGRPFVRADLARGPDDGRRYEIIDGVLIAWELDHSGTYRQVARVHGKEPFLARRPFPVTVVPADLIR